MKKIAKILNRQYKKDFTIDDMEKFSLALEDQMENINDSKSEESIKNQTQKFFESTFYQDYKIDTQDDQNKKETDQLIYNKDGKLNVILEYKKLSNKSEMLTQNDVNKKALHEICLYYFDAMEHDHNEIRHLVITNGLEFYIIASHDFYSFFQDIKNTYTKFIDGKLTSRNHQVFYDEVSKYITKKGDERLKDLFCYFNLKEENKTDIQLKNLYKVLHPNHLLKEYNSDDANSLNKDFYNELLYIIGLEEKKKAGVLLLEKNKNEQSLISLSMYELEDDITSERKRYDVALELSLLWINRILFLKLVESYIVSINDSDKNLFFTEDQLHSFDRFNSLFFNVLGKKEEERRDTDNTIFPNAPYLNSSLFELSALEKKYLRIARLGEEPISLYSKTILSKDKKAKKKLTTPHYIVKFINAFDYSTTENSSDSTKQMINPAILGKVFEKINGYKDGAVFTPAFITEYMARVSIEKVIVNKFKEVYADETIKTYDDVYNIIDDKHKANDIINSIKICDPSVGSGHFLVACLNEILRVKSDLHILLYSYESTRVMIDYTLHIENDDLVIEDVNGNIFVYKRNNLERQKVQEALFREKRIIIENCLFGVDLNPKSVEICKLRLWIELLKSTYYRKDGTFETLPNIDINIKVGNSLISKYPVTQRKKAIGTTKKDQQLIRQYKELVVEYKNTNNKETKNKINENIFTLKNNITGILRDKLVSVSPEDEKTLKFIGKLRKKSKQTINEKEILKIENEIKKLSKTINQLALGESFELEVYKNSLEWSIEFPEVLGNDGAFLGFDLIIGNPPYIKDTTKGNKDVFQGIQQTNNGKYYMGKSDLWYVFAGLSIDLLKDNGILSFIATNNWITNAGGKILRNQLIKRTQLQEFIDFKNIMIFGSSASVQTMILTTQKKIVKKSYNCDVYKFNDNVDLNKISKMIKSKNNVEYYTSSISQDLNVDNYLLFLPKNINSLISKLEKNSEYLYDHEIANGIHMPQDNLNQKNCLKLNNRYPVGTGIFVISQKEKDSLGSLTKYEQEIIKPFYDTKQIQKYSANKNNTHYIIYTQSSINNLTKEDLLSKYPHIIKHLNKFKSVITSDNKPYGLHRARKEEFFKGEKILSLRKCTVEPKFTYVDFDSYVPASFYIIKTNRYNKLYLTAILNSNLIKFFLTHKGKMQGNNFQVDKAPLLTIPIPKLDLTQPDQQDIYDKLTSYGTQMQLLHQEKSTNQTAITTLHKQINALIYQLYNFTKQEIKLIEKGI